jgi:plastocyanin
MHTLAVQLAPILAAEKSKVPFYIAGGLLVCWALLVLGRRGDFPSTIQGQRGVIAVTAILVIAAASMAVVTAGPPAKASNTTTTTSSVLPVEAEGTTSSTTTSTTTASTTPTATTKAPSTAAPTPTVAAGTSLSIAANPSGALAYSTKALAAKAGRVTITMTNMSTLEHNITIAQGSSVLGATPTFAGGSKVLSLILKPGKYTFYCSVPGHRQAGMEGTLTVS